MKRIFVKLCILFIAAVFCQISFASPTGLFFNVTTSNNTVNLNTTIPNHTYQYAGIKINTPGFTLAGAGTECVSTSNGYCLFSVSDTQSKQFTISGTGKMNIQLCLNGKGPFSCQNYSNIPVSQITNNLAYVGSESSSALSLCHIDPNTGNFTGCGDTGTGFTTPTSIAFNAAGTLAYVANYAGGTISICNVNSSTGALSSCSSSGLSFSDPTSVRLNPAGTFLYTTNYSNNTVSKCSVDATTGALSNCNTTGSGFATPQGIAFNAAGTFAYVGSYVLQMSVCNVDAGELTNCTPTASDVLEAPVGITLNSAGTRAYVTYFYPSVVTLCTVDAGALINCNATGSGFSGPDSIGINSAGTIAYVTNRSNDTVSQCNIDASTGELNSCTTAGSGFIVPTGITLH